MDPDDILSLDDLPPEARQLINDADREIAALRDRATRQADELRARAERSAADIETNAEEEVRQRQHRLLRQLKPMQDAYAVQGKLDEALAIRERVRGLKASLLHAHADPGSLAYLEEPRVGSSVLFQVTGATDGAVWGTDVYTGDSTLATACVHAGVLAPGEAGVVRATFVDTLNVTFVGSERNGVVSHSYESWPVGYRLSRS